MDRLMDLAIYQSILYYLILPYLILSYIYKYRYMRIYVAAACAGMSLDNS